MRTPDNPPRRLTAAEAVAALDALDTSDPERCHDEADAILLATAPPKVAEAYRRLIDRSAWWAHA